MNIKTYVLRSLIIAPLLGALFGPALNANAAENAGNVLNVYSYRQEFLVNPLIEAFEKETDIDVKIVFAQEGLVQRLKAEGMNSPADVILTADINRMEEFQSENLLQPVTSDTLSTNIPAQYRHPEGLWYGLTMRARVIYAHKTRVKPGEADTYEDLAQPHMKGRVCARSGKHPYNISLLASVIAAKGIDEAQAWLQGVKDNLARRPQGNDRAQVKAIKEGECDVAIGNSYYFGKMLTNDDKPEEKEWAAAVNLIFPNQSDRGAHVNVSAAAVTQSAKHLDTAIKFLEFLSSDNAQRIFAAENFEYPLKEGVAVDPLVASWGAFKADNRNLAEIVAQHTEAAKMMDRVAFDQ
ncbi:MAG: Fe(3+) ABC transporter substrate-binding protein [Rhodospirillales bacterium]|nr:Fe(3+) ABC transporter substrate-binding protein [Rhodospirillales bacterium]